MDIRLLKEIGENLPDPRRQYGYLLHKLEDIIVIGLLTVLCCGSDFDDMEAFGKARIEWLKKFLELPHGIPDSDTFRRVFERLNPNALQECLNHWLAAQRELHDGEIVNIDGKAIRGSENDEHKAYHVVSAWASENRITLGQTKTNKKSNEITAIPELMDMISVEGCIVTIDAMGCQKAITEKITDKGADYVIALKGNQKNLLEETEVFFEDFSDFAQNTETYDVGHGRKETREYFLETNVAWLPQKPDWRNLKAIGMVRSAIEEKGKIRISKRYYITSVTEVNEFARAVRSHWSIENQLHWCLDVILGEDACRAKKDNSPLNMNILRKTALPILNRVKLHRTSKPKKMFMAALDVSFLERLVFRGK